MWLEKYIRRYGWPEDTEEIEYGLATREHAEAMNELFNRVFEQQRPMEHYLWKACEAPTGEAIAFYAKDKASGRFVASMLGVRRAVRIDGRDAKVIQLCETCSDPAVRAGGIIYQGVIKGGLSQCFDVHQHYWGYGGQSNRTARTVGARWFAYTNVFTLEPLELRLSLEPGLRHRFGALGALLGRLSAPLMRLGWGRPRHGYELRESTSFGPEFDRMWEKHRDLFRVVLSRDAATLDWRYTKNPAWNHRTLVAWKDGEPRGYLIWREWQPDDIQVATVLDFWDGNDADLAEALLDGARRAAARRGCTFLQFSVLPGRPQEEAMRRFSTCRVSPHLEKDHVVLGPTQGTDPEYFPPEAIDNFEAAIDPDGWYYTQGDSDLRD